jgi:hypothetical protein
MNSPGSFQALASDQVNQFPAAKELRGDRFCKPRLSFEAQACQSFVNRLRGRGYLGLSRRELKALSRAFLRQTTGMPKQG